MKPLKLCYMLKKFHLQGCVISAQYADQHWTVQVKAKGGDAYHGESGHNLDVVMMQVLKWASMAERLAGRGNPLDLAEKDTK